MFLQIKLQWDAWNRSIPPSREWKGRGAQNPHLLAAFRALDRAKARAEAAPKYQSPQQRESSNSFAARVASQVK